MAAQSASVEGIVVNSVTHEPLSGVHIRLAAMQEKMNSSEPDGAILDLGQGRAVAVSNTQPIYGAITDREGRFAFSSLKPRVYVIAADRRGFLCLQPMKGGVALKPGEHRTDFKIEMAPRSVITGRVVDQYGDPAEQVTVQAEPVSSNSATAFGWNK